MRKAGVTARSGRRWQIKERQRGMLGIMQDWALTVEKLLDHANKNVPNREIVTRTTEGSIARTSYEAV